MSKIMSAVAVLSAMVLLLAMQTVSAGESKNPPNMGQRKNEPFQTVKKSFSEPDMMYAPFMFWFWDEPLDPAKMAEMSRVMCEQRFSPGYAHGRKNMVKLKSLPDEEWLGEKWFSSFDAALGEAEKQKNYFGYCDEYWWPSFQAKGRVLKKHPELRAVSLDFKVIDTAAGGEVRVPESFFTVAAQLKDVQAGATQTNMIISRSLKIVGAGPAFSWNAPQDGAWRVYVFSKTNHPGAFDGQKCNSIDERLAPAFIDIALEPYAARYGAKMGKTIPGDFIDHEGDYGWKLAWSESLDKRFKEKFGQDIRLVLPLMIDKDAEGLYPKARWEWFETVSDLYAGTFRAITDWHEKRGMYTTAHVWEEGIPPQVSCVGDHMKLLRAMTIPGQDCLGRKALRVHDFKEVESVAEFQDSRAMTELMGAGGFEGKQWGTFNPAFLKQALNSVTAWGMSHVIPHGVFTSRKLTGNPWPPDWYSENPMYPYLHLWTDFCRRVSYINSSGHAVPDVVLYNPMESAWMNTDVSILDIGMWKMREDCEGGRRVNAINGVYSKAIDELTDARVEFLIADRFFLKQMEVGGGKLVRGNFAFSSVVLPPLDILSLDAAAKFVAFAKAGGQVCALGELPVASVENGLNDPAMKAIVDELKSLPTFKSCEGSLKSLLDKGLAGLESPVKFVAGEFAMLQHRRRIDGKDFFWLANNAVTNQDCEVVIRGVKGEAAVWDCESGEVRPVSSVDSKDGSKLKLSFKPFEAYWLVIDSHLPAKVVADVPALKESMVVTGLWKVVFDPAIQPVMEFPTNPPAQFNAGVEKPLEDWKVWGADKFSGLMDYTKTIEVDKVEKRMFMDLGKVCHVAEVWVNGKQVGERLWGPYVFDITKAVRPGRNEIRIRIANLINNSYGDITESGLLGPVKVLAE